MSEADAAWTTIADPPAPPAPAETYGKWSNPRVWPSVIGWVTFVLAANSLYDAVAKVMGIMITNFAGGLSSAMTRPAGIGRVAMAYLVLDPVAAAIGVVAGLCLWRRRRIGRSLHVLWALVTIACATTFPLIILGLPGFDLNRSILRSALGSIYPAFVLVWFLRPGISRQVRLWRSREGRQAARPIHPVWPTVLGVLAVVLGTRGGLFQLLQLCVQAVAYLARWHEWNVRGAGWVVIALYVSLAVLLIVTGCLLLRRRPAGATCAVTYAVIGGAVALASPWLWVLLTLAFRDLRVDLSLSSFISPTNLPLLAIGMLWQVPHLIFPLFLVFWFHRPGIRAQVRSWRQAHPPAARG